MILTRAQLKAEVRTLRALQQADEAMIGRLRQIIAAHEAEPRVAASALAENVRLAHRLEVAEMELAQARDTYHFDIHRRIARFMAEHPLIFQMDPEP